MSENFVIVATHRMQETLAADVADACDRVKAWCIPWRGEAEPPGQGLPSPGMLIAELAQGERQLPADIIDLCTRCFPNLPILLLSREPLIRPTISLQGGRVTLVSPPITRDKIVTWINVLLCGPRVSTGRMLDGEPTPLTIRERRRQHFWIAALGTQLEDPASDRMPILYEEGGSGLTVLLPRASGAPIGPAELRKVIDLLEVEESDDAKQAKLVNHIGSLGGMIHLRPGGEEWMFFWPRVDAPLWLFSAARLPNWWDLTRTLDPRSAPFLRLPATKGDLVAALSTVPLVPGKPTAPSRSDWELKAAMAEGSPAFLDVLERRLTDAPRPFSGTLVELT